MVNRRNFIRNAAIGTAGISFLGSSNIFANVMGANSTINFAILGTGGRAHSLVQSLGLTSNSRITHICDVDLNRLDKFKGYCQETIGYIPTAEPDFRKILELKDVDAVVVATPEHWHAPMAIMAMQAGKHVYVEKPCSHNLHENDLLVAAQKKYNKRVQMGNQQRSSQSSALAVEDIRNGVIGDVYAGKAFYSNTRGSIGKGNIVAVPDTLNWDLWQGPAPREKYRDNVHPYNWHWFRTWGTGEIHNNGTHEIDICRWALGVGFPERVVSTGGRLHEKNDDWEWFDTQIASYEFAGGKMIHWEGLSCNSFRPGGGRGAHIIGTKGSMYLDRGKYILYDMKGKVVKTEAEANQGSSTNTADTQGFDGLTTKHLQNFINSILSDEKLHSDIADAAISTHLCHLGNLAQDLKESLLIDSQTGKVVNNKKAIELWGREYENGWEPKI